MADQSIRIVDGQLSWKNGVDDSKPPTIANEAMPDGLDRMMLSWLSNATCRGGPIWPRTGWLRRAIVGGGGPPPPPPTPGVLSIVTTSLPDCCLYGPYSNQVLAAGSPLAVSPATNFWEISAGALPTNLSFIGGYTSNPYATIQGVPSATGTFNFTVKVTAPAGETATQSYTVVVSGITNASPLATGTRLVPYGPVQLLTYGFSSPSFSLDVGSSLPPGLVLSATGIISGTPTMVGVTSFWVVASEPGLECARVYTIQIVP